MLAKIKLPKRFNCKIQGCEFCLREGRLSIAFTSSVSYSLMTPNQKNVKKLKNRVNQTKCEAFYKLSDENELGFSVEWR